VYEGFTIFANIFALNNPSPIHFPTDGWSVVQPVCPSGQRAFAWVRNQIFYNRAELRSHYRRGTSSLARERIRVVS
jgi:hypothetical protein